MALQAQVELEIGNNTFLIDVEADVTEWRHEGAWCDGPAQFEIEDIALTWTGTGNPVSPIWQRFLTDADWQHIYDMLE